MKIKLVEIFPSFQGEGEDSGKKMVILRFKYCNRIYAKKACNFCDTIQKLNSSEEKEYSLEDIQKVIDDFGPGCGAIITGGEPGAIIEELNINNLDNTIRLIKELNYSIANVETNGCNLAKLTSSLQSWYNTKVNIMYSPKIFNLKDFLEAMKTIKNVSDTEIVKFKIVYQDNDFINDILSLLSDLKLNRRTFLMPEGKTRDELIKNSEDTLKAANKYKFNFSSRLHIIHNFT